MRRKDALTGFVAAAGIAALAHRRGLLTVDGAIAATGVGTLVHAGRGVRGTALMLGFFVSSSALSRVGREQKRRLRVVEKTGPRDAAQVLANGGIAALAAVIPREHAAGSVFAAALATATADTWATEIGTVFGGVPHSLVDGTALAVGISGGTSDAGTAAAVAGSMLLGVLACMTGQGGFTTVTTAGIAGCLADSLLGATVQVRRRCDTCNLACEVAEHCGRATAVTMGFEHLTNDTVNLAATAVGALIALCLDG